MRKRIGKLRWLAALSVVFLGLVSGAVAAEAKDLVKVNKASNLTAGETYTLTTEDTILNMDKDLTLKQIKGNYN